MKTFKEFLKTVDRGEIEELLMERCAPRITHIENEDVTVRQLKDNARTHITEFLDLLERTEPVVLPFDEEAWVFFANDYMENDSLFDETFASLCKAGDLLGENPEAWSWICTPFAEMLGIYVAETPLVRDNPVEFAGDVLFEATFGGYTPEEKEAFNRELEEGLKETENASSGLRELSIRLEDLPKEDAEKERLEQACWDAVGRFNRAMFLREAKVAGELVRRELG